MDKIRMKHAIAEMDGDEMTRILWAMIKKELLEPYIELNTEYYDLGLQNRDKTDDQVTRDAGEANRRLRVGVKCATITPNEQRVEEYGLKKVWKSPNITIRAILDGTVFRAPIIADCIKPAVKNWIKPITIARHAYGDIYRAVEYAVEGPGRAELVYTGADGRERYRADVCGFDGPGVIMAMHNKNSSIRSFAHSCFRYALDRRQDLWFGAKDTILPTYDHAFKNIFNQTFEDEYADAFKEAGIKYFYTLIDDAASRAIRSEGGFIWACKNYDGDVMSDLVSTAFGSLAMMTSVLVSPDGCFEYEAAHGTVTRHYYAYLKGETPGTNPIATIFAWTGALRKRGELDAAGDSGGADACDESAVHRGADSRDDARELVRFANALEAACIKTIESGVMTRDLAGLCEGVTPRTVNALDFLRAIRENIVFP